MNDSTSSSGDGTRSGYELRGRRIVVTRAVEQGVGLANALQAMGAEVLVRPLIRIEAPEAPDRLLAAASRAAEYEWVVFTSANAVDRFMSAIEASGSHVRDLAGARVAAVGPATAEALETHGVAVDLLPPESLAEALAVTLGRATDLRGQRVLWPKAAGASPELARALEKAGARVEAIEAYRTVVDEAAGAMLRDELCGGRIDVITFTSPSTVRAFAAGGADTCGTRVAVIGPVTAAAARRHGLWVDIEPATNTSSGLAAAIREHYGTSTGPRI